MILHKIFETEMTKKLFLFMFLLNFQVNTQILQNKTCNADNKHLIINQIENNLIEYIFTNFKNFSDLIPGCNQAYNMFKVASVKFVPSKRILLYSEDTFSLGKMFKPNRNLIALTLRNFIGLDLSTALSTDAVESEMDYFLIFEHFRLDFYLNETKLKASQCNEETFWNLSSFLRYFYAAFFYKVAYPQEGLCSLVFTRNSRIKVLTFNNVINSLLIKNRLTFLNYSSSFSESSIESLTIQVQYETLTSLVINKHLFKSLMQLNVIEILIGIEQGLLSQFKFLNSIDLSLKNIREFLHEDTKWIGDLNAIRIPSVLDLKNKFMVKKNIRNAFSLWFTSYHHFGYVFERVYDYPDEDLCLFKEFPHSRLVFPILMPHKSIKCTCTIMWLQMYYGIFKEYFKYKFVPGTTYFTDYDYVEYRVSTQENK
jgi:hypothetical protein